MRIPLLFAAALALAACDATDTASLTASASAPVAAADATEADVEGRTLARIRRATAKYRQVERALADGYQLASPCVAMTDADGNEMAAMGYHYVNFGLIEGAAPDDGRSTVIDPSAPEILLYEPQRNGKLRLVGVEFMTAEAGGDGTTPMLDGVAFDDHTADDPAVRHGIPFAHYDLHVWTWRNNPNGMFAPHNPKVSCDYAPSPAE